MTGAHPHQRHAMHAEAVTMIWTAVLNHPKHAMHAGEVVTTIMTIPHHASLVGKLERRRSEHHLEAVQRTEAMTMTSHGENLHAIQSHHQMMYRAEEGREEAMPELVADVQTMTMTIPRLPDGNRETVTRTEMTSHRGVRTTFETMPVKTMPSVDGRRIATILMMATRPEDEMTTAQGTAIGTGIDIKTETMGTHRTTASDHHENTVTAATTATGVMPNVTAREISLAIVTVTAGTAIATEIAGERRKGLEVATTLVGEIEIETEVETTADRRRRRTTSIWTR